MLSAEASVGFIIAIVKVVLNPNPNSDLAPFTLAAKKYYLSAAVWGKCSNK